MRCLWCILSILLSLVARGQTITITASDTAICAGDTVAFTAIATGAHNHFQWLVNGTATGSDTTVFTTDTLHSNDTIRCVLSDSLGLLLASSDSIVMDVNPLPDAGIITGKDTVCLGGTITLTSSATGGSWSMLHSYASINGSGVVTGIHIKGSFECSWWPGLDSAMYIVANGCGQDTAIKKVTVHRTPFAGFYFEGYVCVGGCLSINYGTGPCNDISSTFGYAAANLYICGVHAGTDYLYSRDSNYCGMAFYGDSVRVFDKPRNVQILCQDSMLCVGQAYDLRGSSVASWEWAMLHGKGIFNDNHSLKGTPAQLIAETAGIDTIRLNASNICGQVFAYKTVTINPTPAPVLEGFSCKGHSILLQDSMVGNTWTSSDPRVATLVSSKMMLNDTGLVTINTISSKGCASSQTIEVRLCDAVELFPNPVLDELMIHLTVTDYDRCIVTNAIGQTIGTIVIKQEYTSIKTSAWTTGVYYLRFTGDAGTHTAKILKE